MKPTIFRDFDHYWQEGDHGWSSASMDLTKAEWDRFEPTIKASRDDYKQMYVELCKKEVEARFELVDALFQYIERFTKDGSPNFFRWWSNQVLGE